MAADDFEIMPTWVYPEEPIYPNVITESENYKKDYQNLDTTPLERFKLVFEGLTDAQAETIYEHYKGRYGGYDSFAWKNSYIPSYIIDLLDLSTSDLTGRWIEGSFNIKPRAKSYDIEIVFEKAVT